MPLTAFPIPTVDATSLISQIHASVLLTRGAEFMPGVLPPGVSFTRASIASFVNSAGNIEIAAADQPRFDFDPVTLALRGLLLEPARTNLLLHSANFAVVPWYKSLVTIEANAAIAPDGSNTAAKVVSAGGAYPQIWQATTHTAGQPYTWSIWVKSDGTPQISQTLIHDGVNISFTPTSTWQRIAITKPASSGGSRTVVLTTNSPAAPASSFLIWGAQLELGAAASSYIPTTTAAVTRAADNPRVTPNLGRRGAKVTTEAGIVNLTDQAFGGAYWPALTLPARVQKLEVL